MRRMRRILVLALAASVVAVLALVAVQSLGPGGETTQTAVQLGDEAATSGGDASEVGIKGIIEWTVWDASGKVKTSGVIHNAVNDEAKNETFNRIAASATGGAYDGIAALQVAVGTDDPANGTDADSLTDNIDGNVGECTSYENPADGTVATDFGTETGNGTVTVTFTACNDSVDVMQIVLTKAAEFNNAAGGGVAIADDDIFAYVDVPDIVLNTGDTVQYTWTVDVD